MATVEESIVNWINSFENVDANISSLTELVDGVVLYKILEEVSPLIWQKSEMDFDGKDTDSGKINNIKHIFEGIQEFYKTKLSNDIRDNEVSINQICKNMNMDEIIRLCELAIGVVVQCDEKEEYIGAILNLDEDTQSDLMDIIQKTMAGSSHNSSVVADEDVSSHNHSISEDNLNSSISAAFESQIQIDKYKKENQTLKMKLGDSEEENGQLKAQLEKISLEHRELTEDFEVEKKKNNKETKSNDKAEEAIGRLELTERELEQVNFDYKNQTKKVEVLEAKIEEMRMNYKDEKENMSNDMDEYKSKCRKLEQMETVNNMYKKKLEETADFKNRINELKEQNESLVSQLEGISYFSDL